MNQNLSERKSVELRSEKVRSIIGEVPPILLRKGIAIITFVIAVAFAIANLLTFPETIPLRVNVIGMPENEIIKAPNTGIIELIALGHIEKGQIIGFLITKDGILEDVHSKTSGTLITNCEGNTFLYKDDIISAVIPDDQKLYATGYINSKKIDEVKSGQSVKIKLQGSRDSLGKEVEGTVVRIYPIADGGSEARIDIDIPIAIFSEELGLYTELKGSGNIIVSNNSLFNRLLNINNR
uniref:HlyD family efflux transporter periplasmic adaptor subunit n=1 Tax=uncultured Dysgonomonas sp. TaxID=206096 RepID=UPI002618C2E1|nr:HlyD family efflux transporter periplasmic adaptor subunit [uncultured Dysgonomonas sp.]